MIFQKLREYIFLNGEGETYMPDVVGAVRCIETAVSNLQVIGYAKGRTPKEAFINLLKGYDNPVNGNNFLKDSSFDYLICHEVCNRKCSEIFSIKKESDTLVKNFNTKELFHEK